MEVNVLVPVVFNVIFNLTNESQIRDIRENIFQENALGPLHRN